MFAENCREVGAGAEAELKRDFGDRHVPVGEHLLGALDPETNKVSVRRLTGARLEC